MGRRGEGDLRQEIAERVGRFRIAAADLIGGPRYRERNVLGRRQRSLLLRGFEADLRDQVEDAEERGVTKRGLSELTLSRAVIRWLRGGAPPPPEEAIDLFKQGIETIKRTAAADELLERDALLTAIGALGGDAEAASELWRTENDDDGQRRAFGQELKERMDAAGLDPAGLAERSGLEESAIVVFIHGAEEPLYSDIILLAGALGIESSELVTAAGARYDRERGDSESSDSSGASRPE
jgi:transposase InsO family protein